MPGTNLAAADMIVMDTETMLKLCTTAQRVWNREIKSLFGVFSVMKVSRSPVTGLLLLAGEKADVLASASLEDLDFMS